jgi:hypothetical protein
MPGGVVWPGRTWQSRSGVGNDARNRGWIQKRIECGEEMWLTTARKWFAAPAGCAACRSRVPILVVIGTSIMTWVKMTAYNGHASGGRAEGRHEKRECAGKRWMARNMSGRTAKG